MYQRATCDLAVALVYLGTCCMSSLCPKIFPTVSYLTVFEYSYLETRI